MVWVIRIIVIGTDGVVTSESFIERKSRRTLITRAGYRTNLKSMCHTWRATHRHSSIQSSTIETSKVGGFNERDNQERHEVNYI